MILVYSRMRMYVVISIQKYTVVLLNLPGGLFLSSAFFSTFMAKAKFSCRKSVHVVLMIFFKFYDNHGIYCQYFLVLCCFCKINKLLMQLELHFILWFLVLNNKYDKFYELETFVEVFSFLIKNWSKHPYW